jgi:hypothetical protein
MHFQVYRHSFRDIVSRHYYVPGHGAARCCALVSANGRFPYTANLAAVAYFLAVMAWSTVW